MRVTTTVLLAGLAALGGCGAEPGAEQVDGADALRFSVIPDWNKGKLKGDAELLARLLSERLGQPVRYLPSNDYTACVNGLVANKLDFAWLGGKTTCDAIDAGGGSVHVLATRDIDLAFKSYFIGNREAIAAGKLAPMQDLAELREHAAGLTFTFGDVNSTSGHLMPRHFLVLAGIDPDDAFKSVGYAQGSHSGTLKSVADGAVDCGALNFAYYDAAPPELQAKAPVVFTTPEYVDYAWVAHARIGAESLAALQAALLGLDRGDHRERAMLDAWAAGRFVAARDEQWQAIRQVRDSLPKDFLK